MSRVTNIPANRWLAVALGLLAVVVIMTFALSQPTTFAPGQVLIIGDSITEKPAMATNQGNLGWWQYLLDGRKDMFKFSVESGSGYVAKGSRGTTFYDRLTDIGRVKPKAIIIAGGVNDRHASNAADAVRTYYDALFRTLRKYDIPARNVYVFVPRTAGDATEIDALVKSNAERIGAHFVSVPGYSTTFDGLHPDSAGAKQIEQGFVTNSDFDERLE